MRPRTQRRAWGRATIVAASLALSLAACGGSGSDGAATSAGPTASASAPAGGVAAPAVLQFKAPLLSGGALDGTTYTGKPVAFWFWAPW